MAAALQIALILALPLIAVVALIGIIMGLVQTIVQVQDQNIAFLPKLLGVACVLALAGAPALALLVHLFRVVVAGALRSIGH